MTSRFLSWSKGVDGKGNKFGVEQTGCLILVRCPSGMTGETLVEGFAV